MRRKGVLFLIFAVIILTLGVGLLASRIHEVIPGAITIELAGSCTLTHFDTTLQPVNTLVLACPKMDMIKLWPLPIEQPWFEDVWGKPSGNWVIQL